MPMQRIDGCAWKMPELLRWWAVTKAVKNYSVCIVNILQILQKGRLQENLLRERYGSCYCSPPLPNKTVQLSSCSSDPQKERTIGLLKVLVINVQHIYQGKTKLCHIKCGGSQSLGIRPMPVGGLFAAAPRRLQEVWQVTKKGRHLSPPALHDRCSTFTLG